VSEPSAASASGSPGPGDSARMREQLEDLKSEIEAFLQELEA
jgi:hypothetical protein